MGQGVLCTSLNGNLSPSTGDVFRAAEMMGNQYVTGEQDFCLDDVTELSNTADD